MSDCTHGERAERAERAYRETLEALNRANEVSTRFERERDDARAEYREECDEVARISLAADEIRKEVERLRAVLRECRPLVDEACRPLHRDSRYHDLLARLDAALEER